MDGQPSSGPPFSNLSSGPHTITLIASAGVCRDTFSQSITIIAPAPTARIEADQLLGCSPLQVNFKAGGSLAENVDYSWNFNRTSSDISTDYDPAAIAFSNFIDTIIQIPVTLTVSNACNETSDQVMITIRPQPQALAGTSLSSYCSGDNISVINGSRGLVNQFEWYYDGQLVSNEFQPPFIFRMVDRPTAVNILLIASNECGPDTSASSIVIEPTDVTSNFNIAQPQFCPGDSILFTNLSNTDNVYYSFGDGSNSSQPNPIHVFQESGQFKIVQKSFGCGFDSTAVTIKINPLPDANFEHLPETCPGTPLELRPISNEQLSYTWKVNDQIVSTQKNPKITFDSVDIYNISLETNFLQDNSCSNETSSLVTVSPLPVAQLEVPDSICAGAIFNATNTSANGSFTSCLWKQDGEQIGDLCTLPVSIEEPGLHSMTLQITNDIGCVGSASKTVFIRSTPLAAFDYRLDFDCSPSNVLITDKSINATGYNWLLDGQMASLEQEPSFSLENGGDYRLSLIASQDGICFDTITQDIHLPATPRSDHEIIDDRCFPKEEVILEINNPGDYFIEVRGLENDYFLSGKDRYEVVNPGLYKADITTPEGCDTTFTFEILPFQEVIVKVMEDTTLLLGSPVKIKSLLNSKDLVLNWSPTDFLNDPTVAEPVSTPLKSTQYILLAQLGNCIYRDSVVIYVDNSSALVFAPNIFNSEDKFKLYWGKAVTKVEYLKIFDRWGELVHKAENIPPDQPYEGWDGTFNGETLNPQVFVYIARVEIIGDQVMNLSGDVVLVR